MSRPKRIQRKRTRNWRLPAGAVCVTRPGKFGNPFSVLPRFDAGKFVAGSHQYIAVPTVEDSLACFREYVGEMIAKNPKWLDELRGKDLACWCKIGEPCHADILIELANK